MADSSSLWETRLDVLHEDVTEIKSNLSKLTDAIVKLALIEERQAQSAQAMERAFKTIEKIDLRLTELEKNAPEAARVARWFDRSVGATVAVIFAFVAKQAGLL
jgi:hypothetical protein